MASGEKKLSVMDHITSAPDNAKLYVVLPDGSYGYIEKSELLAGISGGTTPTLPQVLAQGGRTVLKIDETTETYTTVEADRGKIIYIPSSAAAFSELIIDEVYAKGDTLMIYSEAGGQTITLNGTSYFLPEIVSSKTMGNSELILISLFDDTSDNIYSYNIIPFEINIPTINEHYKGTYTSLSALETAHPTASLGDYAIVDAGAGNDAIQYIWDAQEGWVAAGTSSLTTTDSLTEGTINLYFTVARVLATALTGLSTSDGSDITSANSILVALGKLQKQLTDVRAAKADKSSWMAQTTPHNLTDTTALQKLFNVGSSGNGSRAVVAGKKYRAHGWVVFSGLSGSSKNISFGILGTATASFVSGYGGGVLNPNVTTASINDITSFSANQLVVNSANTYGKIYFDFLFNCNGSGTIIPAGSLSISTSGMQVIGGYFECYEIGDSSSTSSSDII